MADGYVLVAAPQKIKHPEACDLLIHEGGHEVDLSGMLVFFATQLGTEHSQLSFFNQQIAALQENAAVLLGLLLLFVLALLLLVGF